MSTPRKARSLGPRVQVTEHTINLVCPAKVTEHVINLVCPVKVTERTINLLPPGFQVAVTRSTINLPCCFVRVEKEK